MTIDSREGNNAFPGDISDLAVVSQPIQTLGNEVIGIELTEGFGVGMVQLWLLVMVANRIDRHWLRVVQPDG